MKSLFANFAAISTIALSLTVLLTAPLEAQNLGCRWLGIGCPTEADRQKAIQNCQRQARAYQQEHYREAVTDPTLWKLGGYESANDYARKRAQSLMYICVKSSVPTVPK